MVENLYPDIYINTVLDDYIQKKNSNVDIVDLDDKDYPDDVDYEQVDSLIRMDNIAIDDAISVETQEVTREMIDHAKDMVILDKYMFPIEERLVYYDLVPGTSVTGSYKAIVRSDNDKLISIMRDSYKVVPNRLVIGNVMNELDKLDTRWVIDTSHSYVTDERMKLHITFPDILMNDGESDIALSCYIHNSYDGSEGVRMLWGAIRAICTNGMIWGKVLSKFYHRHTQGINIGSIKRQLSNSVDKIPLIQTRMKEMVENENVSEIYPSIKKLLGKGIYDHVVAQTCINDKVTQWMLYNMVTYYISHTIEQRMRTHYQLQASKVFGI